MKHMLLCMSIALGVGLSAVSSGHAYSIGEIKVQSHLHTPFVAEVPLIIKPRERDEGFIAVIGDERDYKAEGMTRVPVIESLRPSLILGASDVIRIISTEPIDIPAFDLLLLVQTGTVTIVQNYPVTLTPDPRTAPIVAKTTLPAPQVARQKPGATSPMKAAWLAHLPARYGPILRGEVLYKVMTRLHVPKPYIWPAAVRIWEYNQDRFVRGNLHGLRTGEYLEIPEDLHHSPPKVSPREAQQIVAAQWDQWQKPARMVVASVSIKTVGVGQTAPSAPAPPAAQAPEAVAFDSAADTASPVNMATLESMLQGFERRLAQRLSLPGPAAAATDEHAITFVSTGDLQTAMEGLEARLIQQLETGQRPAGAWQSNAASQPPSLRVGMETALASFLSADSLVYVFIVQNVVLLVIAAGIAWRWYRKRTTNL